MLGLGGGRTSGATFPPTQTVQTHQALHPFMVTGDAALRECGMDARATIGLAAVAVNGPDFPEQHCIRLLTLAGSPCSPRIVTTGTDFQHPTHEFHLKLAGLLGNEDILVQCPSRLNTT